MAAPDPEGATGLWERMVKPSGLADAAWTLEGGAAVQVLEREVVANNVGTQDAWMRIRSADGKMGWVLESELVKSP